MQEDEVAVVAGGIRLHGGGEAVEQAAPVGPLGLALGGQVGWSGHPRVQVPLALVLLRLGGTRQVRERYIYLSMSEKETPKTTRI